MARLIGAARSSALLRVSTEIAKAFVLNGKTDEWYGHKIARESVDIATELIDLIYQHDNDECEDE